MCGISFRSTSAYVDLRTSLFSIYQVMYYFRIFLRLKIRILTEMQSNFQFVVAVVVIQTDATHRIVPYRSCDDGVFFLLQLLFNF